MGLFTNNRKPFIGSQIPEYIRSTYPLFVSFLEAYYDYLDRSLGQLIAVVVTNPGFGYSTSPVVSIATSSFVRERATARAHINSAGIVTAINIIII